MIFLQNLCNSENCQNNAQVPTMFYLTSTNAHSLFVLESNPINIRTKEDILQGPESVQPNPGLKHFKEDFLSNHITSLRKVAFKTLYKTLSHTTFRKTQFLCHGTFITELSPACVPQNFSLNQVQFFQNI